MTFSKRNPINPANRSLSLCIACIFFFGSPGLQATAKGEIVTVPADLPVGTQYRLVFVTSVTFATTSANINDYNNFVDDVANNLNGQSGSLIEGLSQWRAIGSTTTVDARDNTNSNAATDGPGVPIYSITGARLANDYADLWDGTLLNDVGGTSGTERDTTPITFNVSSVDIQFAYTGSSNEGTAVFGSPLGTPGGTAYGAAMIISGNVFADSWVSAGGGGPEIGPYYGMSNILTVPVPEPVGAPLFLMGFAMFSLPKRSRS